MRLQRVRHDWATFTYLLTPPPAARNIFLWWLREINLCCKWATTHIRGLLLQLTCLPMQETQETRVRSLDWEDPLEKRMATHSSTPAWKIPWTEEPGRLQSLGLQRIQNWAHTFTLTKTEEQREKGRLHQTLAYYPRPAEQHGLINGSQTLFTPPII